MQTKINKLFLNLAGMPIIARTVRIFQNCPEIHKILLITSEDSFLTMENIVRQYGFQKVENIVLGGRERQDSVYNGLMALENADDDDIVIIHNGANPFVDQNTIYACISAASEYGAAAVGFRARDTIKVVDDNNFVRETLDRTHLVQMQTPQAMRYHIARQAFAHAGENKIYGTDDVSLVEKLGLEVKIVDCPYENIKITLPNDLNFGESLLNNARVGLGMDSHAFVDDSDPKPLVLGGTVLENETGFKANSDGDVILHSLFNAISQALGEKSIGHYADDMCGQGIKNSARYLDVILNIMQNRGYEIGNVGIVLEGKRPKIYLYENRIKKSLAALLDLDESKIGIIATSGEGLTSFGRGEGMQCFSIVALRKI